MSLTITGLYAGLLAIVGLALTFHAGSGRAKTGISLGTGSSDLLLERVRRHANFIETVPIALILLAVLESSGKSAVTLHVLGSTLLVARIIHPFGLSATDMKKMPRFIGMLLTILVIFVSACMAIWQYVGLMLTS